MEGIAGKEERQARREDRVETREERKAKRARRARVMSGQRRLRRLPRLANKNARASADAAKALVSGGGECHTLPNSAGIIVVAKGVDAAVVDRGNGVIMILVGPAAALEAAAAAVADSEDGSVDESTIEALEEEMPNSPDDMVAALSGDMGAEYAKRMVGEEGIHYCASAGGNMTDARDEIIGLLIPLRIAMKGSERIMAFVKEQRAKAQQRAGGAPVLQRHDGKGGFGRFTVRR